MQVKTVPITPQTRVKAGPDDGLADGEFLVYPSTFTRTPDAYGDVVAKGAFAGTLAEWHDSGNTMPGLYGHRMDDPDYFVAGASEMGEDDHGWWVKGAFDLESPKGNQVYRLTKGRRLSQLSFAYDVLDEGKIDLGGGETANELRKLKVYEFSFVPIGANQDTSVVAVKSSPTSPLRDIVDNVIGELKSSFVTHDELTALLGVESTERKTSASDPGAGDEEKTGQQAVVANAEDPKGNAEERPRISPASVTVLAELEQLS
jgi:HK97 family phage prohead protease